MNGFTRVMLVGNLVARPEVKTFVSGSKGAKCRVAVSRKYTTGKGERREETTFVPCDAFGRTAEVMAEYLDRGSKVFIEGRLKLDEWQSKDGSNRSMLKVVVENCQFLDPKGTPKRADPEWNGEPIEEDDISF